MTKTIRTRTTRNKFACEFDARKTIDFAIALEASLRRDAETEGDRS
ncbi:hypothetical protein MPEAHAMD_7230 [Methylobacterium frigidaeris]|uniref:Uncharacterized protein n=1 Tax=Methylobacterium frigidaeris TaxID=2038277 RepID=A0AA37M9B1_9HYPH|nr:hypothetical protein MPEAHAMD_7230 [Methylobacterium frigidaeris]